MATQRTAVIMSKTGYRPFVKYPLDESEAAVNGLMQQCYKLHHSTSTLTLVRVTEAGDIEVESVPEQLKRLKMIR